MKPKPSRDDMARVMERLHRARWLSASRLDDDSKFSIASTALGTARFASLRDIATELALHDWTEVEWRLLFAFAEANQRDPNT